MKNKILKAFLFLFLVVFGKFGLFAADIYHYQEQFNDIVDLVQYGDAPKDSLEFDEVVESLKVLYSDLAKDKGVKKKIELLNDIKTLCQFMGEVSPDRRSYYLTRDQRRYALQLLGIQEERYTYETRSRMPIYKITLYDGQYTAFMVDNKNDTMMVLYKYDFVGQTKHTTYTGVIEDNVSRGCSHCLYSTWGQPKNIRFNQTRHELEFQDLVNIQPEIIQPKVEAYPEPDYLTKEEKQALKKKNKEKLKKEKAKAKKKALKAKKKKKKEMMKQREKMRKQQAKQRKQAAKEKVNAKKIKQQELEEKKKSQLEAKKQAAKESANQE
jgi:hypothetical protein